MEYDSENALAIIGYHDGAAGQVETWIEESTGLNLVCFINDADAFQEVDISEENNKRICQTTAFPQDGFFKGRPLISSLNWLNELRAMRINKVVCLEPDNNKRLKYIRILKENNIQLVSAIHPTVKILANAKVADGVWVNAGAIIGYKAELAAGVIINTGVQIDHHNIIEECCQIDPGVITAGNVVLRECCHIHTGAVLINRIEVGKNAIVGAGTVVIKNVLPKTTVVGVPAREVKHNHQNFG